jgi:hypothetical protein
LCHALYAWHISAIRRGAKPADNLPLLQECRISQDFTGETNMLKPIRRLAKAIKGKTVEEREFAYLAEAYDLIDLEYRQRQIDRGLFGR